METTKIRTEQQFKVSEVQVSYKPNFKPSERPKITKSQELYEVLKSTWDDGKLHLVEQFKVVMLNRANRVIGIFEVSQGGTSGTVADPKIIFATALKANASYLCLSHNHPSGNLKPSQSDISITMKLKVAGEYLDLTVIDHLIITSETYYSFSDEGIM